MERSVRDAFAHGLRVTTRIAPVLRGSIGASLAPGMQGHVGMTPKTILVPIDFGDISERALDYACGLAHKLGAKIDLVNAIGMTIPELAASLTDPLIESLRIGNRTLLEKLAKDRSALATFDRLVIEPGDPRHAIIKVADALQPDLIVIGSHARHGVQRFLLGSVAEYVVRHAAFPVLVYHAPKPN